MGSSPPKDFAASDGKTVQTIESSENEDDVKPFRRRKLGADKEMMHAFLSSVEFNPSRLRSRKEIPAQEILETKKRPLKSPVPMEVDFKMVDISDEEGPSIIGRRVEVFWPDSRRWFRGRIKAFDHQTMVHKIDYDDGDRERLDLKNEVFRMEVYPGEIVTIKPECDIKRKLKRPIVKDSSDDAEGTAVDHHNICFGLPDKESGNSSSFQKSLPQVEMAVNVNSYSDPDDEPLDEACLELKNKEPKYHTVPDITKPKEENPNSAFKSSEDGYLNILQREAETEDPKLPGEHFEHRVGKKYVRPCSEKWELRLELHNEDRIPVNTFTYTNYYVRRKRPTSNISKE